MKNLLFIWAILIALSACESMEDTYAEYNTPKERYVGKVSDLKIEQGWKRFRLSWTNSVDAAIVNIKVKWEDESNVADSVILPAGTEVYLTDTIFGHQNYKFSVTSIDSRNKESFPVAVYENPFTEKSSKVEAYRVMEKKFFFVNDQVIIRLYETGKDIYDAQINYTSNGVQKVLNVAPEDFENELLILENVELNSDVTISGKMKIAECIDTIPLITYALDRDKRTWSGSFIGNVRRQFDMLDVTTEHLDTLSTLYVDYDIQTLEDILYMPNLTKVVLGKRRMYDDYKHLTDTNFVGVVSDFEASVFALQKMHELKGLEVEIFGNQYRIRSSLSFEIVNTRNTPPALIIPDDIDNWEATINDPAYYNNEDAKDNHSDPLSYIMGKKYYVWESIQQNDEIKTHEITYDMKELKEVIGFQYYQPDNEDYSSYLPERVEVYISTDGVNWEPAFFQAGFEVGGTTGEVTVAYMRAAKTAQYVKMVVRDIDGGKNNYVVIDEFLPILE